MNKVFLIGRLTKDVEERRKEDKVLATFTVAVDEVVKKNGVPEKTAQFIECVAFGNLASNMVKYTKKGSQVAVEGRINNYSYAHKDGTTRNYYRILVSSVQFLEPRKVEEEKPTAAVVNDELPF